MEARGVARLLQVHPEIEQIHEHLAMALRLHVAPHHAERHQRHAVLRHERGNDGVERPLARLQVVGMTFLEREQGPAVLQAESEVGNRVSRAEPGVVALDQRHHHPPRVGGAQERGLATVERRELPR